VGKEAEGVKMTAPDTFTEEELANWLDVSPAILKAWRSHGTGPRWMETQGAIVYHRPTVEEWLQNGAVLHYSKDLAGLTDKELRAALDECGPSVESGQAIRVVGEIQRRAQKKERRFRIAAKMTVTLLAALITASAVRWAKKAPKGA
jgi:hypothetical protein